MYGTTVDLMRLRYPRRRSRWPSVLRRAVLGVGAFGLLAFGLAHAAQGSSAGAYETVSVRPGDTLWAIAAERYPNADTRDKVDQIEHANGLSDPVIHPGQTLRVPNA
jgi:nucleoid-associated protein YgaU